MLVESKTPSEGQYPEFGLCVQVIRALQGRIRWIERLGLENVAESRLEAYKMSCRSSRRSRDNRLSGSGTG